MSFSPKTCLVLCLAIFSVHALDLEDTEPKSHTAKNIIRLLSKYFKPESYDVRLWPIFENGSFQGTIQIQMLCLKSYDHVRLNAYDIDIDVESVKIINQNYVTLPCAPNTENVLTNEIFTIRANFVGGNFYTISLNFQTRINDNFRGLHRIPYMQDETVKYVYAVQTKPIETRRIFPCFDEPGYFVSLNLTVGRPENLTTISNGLLMLSTTTDESSGYVWDHYFPLQMPMSLNGGFGMIMSDFTAIPIKSDSANKKMLAIHVRDDFSVNFGLVNQEAGNIFSSFEQYLNRQFPLSKLDFVAVPEIAYGIQNTGSYGLSIQSESNLLYDAHRSTTTDKHRVFTSIAHSIANQWVGTYVNLKWWNNTWEVEALSSYLQTAAIDATFPNDRMSDRLAETAMQEAMEIDALENVEPLTENPLAIQDIYDKFNKLIANKGVSLMRMCESILGVETMARGVSSYLTSAQPTSLWKTLQQQAVQENLALPFDIGKVMEEWINQPGYSVVHVARYYDAQGRVLITQDRYSLSNSATDSSWTIPLYYTFNFNEIYNATIQGYNSLNLQKLGDKNQPLFFNARSTGYYRVMYDNYNNDMILSQLLKNHTSIPAMHRARLLDDTFNLARAGRVDYATALRLMQYLRFERDLIPWMAADKVLGYVDDMLHGSPTIDQWRGYVNDTLRSLYQYFFESEDGIYKSDDESQLRALIYHWMCVRLEDPHCINRALHLYSTDRFNLPPDQRFVVVCTVLAQGSKDEWNFALESYRNQSLLSSERLEYLQALGCSKNKLLLTRALEMTLNSSELSSKNDALLLFKTIASKQRGNEIAIDFFIQHWRELTDRFGDTLIFGAEPLPLLFRFLCSQLNTAQKLKNITDFYNSENEWTVMHQSQMARQGLETANNNVIWVVNFEASIRDWLNNLEMPNSAPKLITKTIFIMVFTTITCMFSMFSF